MNSSTLAAARARFDEEAARGYLAVASMGLPTRDTLAALRADLDVWESGRRDPSHYVNVQEETRAIYAKLVGVDASRVATGSQTSVMTSMIAASVPSGAGVLVVDGDFSSITYPFQVREDLRVRAVPLEALADAIDESTWLVCFSLAQSATGHIADVPAILEAARAHGAFTVCDTTQSAGVYPVDASLFDATMCHAYKWLCSPRGVAFLTLSERFESELVPVQAGWCAGEDIWKSAYGPAMHLAPGARKFDVSPAWPAWVGAQPAIELFASLDMVEVWEYTTGLANMLCEAVGLPQQNQSIVSWDDPDGTDLARLTAAGITASGRAGRARTSFHLWNTADDVEAARRALA